MFVYLVLGFSMKFRWVCNLTEWSTQANASPTLLPQWKSIFPKSAQIRQLAIRSKQICGEVHLKKSCQVICYRFGEQFIRKPTSSEDQTDGKVDEQKLLTNKQTHQRDAPSNGKCHENMNARQLGRVIEKQPNSKKSTNKTNNRTEILSQFTELNPFDAQIIIIATCRHGNYYVKMMD